MIFFAPPENRSKLSSVDGFKVFFGLADPFVEQKKCRTLNVTTIKVHS